MIGRDAEDVLNRAVRYAFERRHEYFTLEHVLLSLLEETDVLEAIQGCGASYTDIKKDLEHYLDHEVPQASRKSEDDKSDDEDSLEENIMEHPVATLSIQRMIQRALFHVQSAGKDEITPIDLFVAVFQSKDSYALHLLEKQGLKRLEVINYISHGDFEGAVGSDSTTEKTGETKGLSKVPRNPPVKKPGTSALDNYTINLNQYAKEGRIDPLIGREAELERMTQVLCRRQKNNPLLIGEAGVGKTALAEGLALKVVNREVPKILENAVVYALDLASLLAGAKFRGDFESRFKKVLQALKVKRKEGQRPILLIDEIHTIIGAGAVTGSVLDAANMIKPFLSRGEMQCIGSTTYKEYRSTFEKDTALARRFQKIEVPEPSLEEANQILQGLKDKYEQHHAVEYTNEAVKAAVDLSSKHLTDRFLPDKAIDVIDEVGARSRLKRTDEGTSDEVSVIDTSDVEEMIAKMARIPTRTVSTSQKMRLKNLERDLKLTIFGQNDAVESVVTAIRLARSGLRTGERPVGSFLFVGPTGVGKTELSKQLAHSLGTPFLRFDMSEYMEKHTVSRLIGAPPGYVGFEQAGLLTDAVLKNPHSVVLLDEIEKAHFDVWNILLQIMDHGMLTDHNGRKVDFRNTILIMTSNVGTRDHERAHIGEAMQGQHRKRKESVSRPEIERTFSPEFRNRLDSIIYFAALDPVTIGQVVGKQLIEIENQLLEKRVELEVGPEVREWLAGKGYDRKMGARPMARLIREKIAKPLSEEILFGKLEHGGRVVIGLDEKKDELSFEVEPKKDSSVAVGPRAEESDTDHEESH